MDIRRIGEKALDLYTTPEEEGLDPHIWSRKKTCTPLSYMTPWVLAGIKYHIHAPPPTYLKYSELIPKPEDAYKENILFGYTPIQTGALKCIDQNLMNKMKGVVGDVIS